MTLECAVARFWEFNGWSPEARESYLEEMVAVPRSLLLKVGSKLPHAAVIKSGGRER